MKIAMKNIQEHDYITAVENLDKSLKIYPSNPSALYFKAYSQIILGNTQNGCNTLIDAIYFNSNSAKPLFAEKCIDYNPKLDINHFKTGKFKLSILGDSSFTYNIERKNNIQYETYDGKTYSGKIQWLNKGEYIITSESTDADPKFITRVLKVEKNKYLYGKIEENQIQFGIIEKIE